MTITLKCKEESITISLDTTDQNESIDFIVFIGELNLHGVKTSWNNGSKDDRYIFDVTVYPYETFECEVIDLPQDSPVPGLDVPFSCTTSVNEWVISGCTDCSTDCPLYGVECKLG